MATSPKQQFLDAYDREHATTMRVLKAFPREKGDAKLNPNLKTAKELAFVFFMECMLGTKLWDDGYAKGVQPGSKPPEPPAKWDDLLASIEKAAKDFRQLVSSTSEAKLGENVSFMVAPKKLGADTRLHWAWFLLHDQIHHRGQFSTYLRLAGAKVPSIYGPTADEPWI